MINIKTASYNTICKEEYKGILSLRYEVFKERLQWDLEADQELESDQYDHEKTEYLYANDEYKNILGCWRILPTTGDYMLKNTFPELLGNEVAPNATTTFELSRFAVKKHQSAHDATVSHTTMKMFRAIYCHAVANGIEEYVTVTSTAIERILKRVGIPFNRIGDKKVHLLGHTKSIAISIPINKQFRQAVMH